MSRKLLGGKAGRRQASARIRAAPNKSAKGINVVGVHIEDLTGDDDYLAGMAASLTAEMAHSNQFSVSEEIRPAGPESKLQPKLHVLTGTWETVLEAWHYLLASAVNDISTGAPLTYPTPMPIVELIRLASSVRIKFGMNEVRQNVKVDLPSVNPRVLAVVKEISGNDGAVYNTMGFRSRVTGTGYHAKDGGVLPVYLAQFTKGGTQISSHPPNAVAVQLARPQGRAQKNATCVGPDTPFGRFCCLVLPTMTANEITPVLESQGVHSILGLPNLTGWEKGILAAQVALHAVNGEHMFLVERNTEFCANHGALSDLLCTGVISAIASTEVTKMPAKLPPIPGLLAASTVNSLAQMLINPNCTLLDNPASTQQEKAEYCELLCRLAGSPFPQTTVPGAVSESLQTLKNVLSVSRGHSGPACFTWMRNEPYYERSGSREGDAMALIATFGSTHEVMNAANTLAAIYTQHGKKFGDTMLMAPIVSIDKYGLNANLLVEVVTDWHASHATLDSNGKKTMEYGGAVVLDTLSSYNEDENAASKAEAIAEALHGPYLDSSLSTPSGTQAYTNTLRDGEYKDLCEAHPGMDLLHHVSTGQSGVQAPPSLGTISNRKVIFANYLLNLIDSRRRVHNSFPGMHLGGDEGGNIFLTRLAKERHAMMGTVTRVVVPPLVVGSDKDRTHSAEAPHNPQALLARCAYTALGWQTVENDHSACSQNAIRDAWLRSNSTDAVKGLSMANKLAMQIFQTGGFGDFFKGLKNVASAGVKFLTSDVGKAIAHTVVSNIPVVGPVASTVLGAVGL